MTKFLFGVVAVFAMATMTLGWFLLGQLCLVAYFICYTVVCI